MTNQLHVGTKADLSFLAYEIIQTAEITEKNRLSFQGFWYIKFYGWSGVRFSVQFLVFIILIIGLSILEKCQCRQICIDTVWFIHKNFRLVWGLVFCPVSGFCTYVCIKIFLKKKNFCCTSNSF